MEKVEFIDEYALIVLVDDTGEDRTTHTQQKMIKALTNVYK